MRICEDRITEDATEFEKEFLKIYDGNLWTALDKMKDWQPPKPLVVVPKFFADWFENQLKNNESKKFDGDAVFRIIQDVIKVSNGESTWEDYGITDEIAKFAEDNEELFLNLIVNCSLGYGYTVEKEKLYVLKHIDMSKFSEDSSLYLSRSIKAEVFRKYDHMRVADGVDMSEIEAKIKEEKMK